MITSTTRDVIDRIFKEPGIKYELIEFESLGKPIHEILSISPKTVETGRDTCKTKYYLKSIVPFSSGKDEVQVYVDGGKSVPEEIVRQLWVYKLIHQYGYKKEFDDTLFDIPRRGQEPKDVLEAKKTLLQLRKEFNFKKIVQDLEELVLADSGKDEFNEIFKLIFAKIWDEKEAQENRKDSALRFETKLEKATLARMAFALSLAKEGPDVAQSPSFTGGEMKRPTFVGEDEVFMRALICHVYQKRDIGEDPFFSNRSIVKNHIDSGAVLLGQLFQECGRDADNLLMRLVDEVEFGGRRETARPRAGYFYRSNPAAAQRTNHGDQQYGPACQLAPGHHGQAGHGENAVHIKDPGGYSPAVQLSNQFHLFRLQGRCGR